jgi:hypothetical protein
MLSDYVNAYVQAIKDNDIKEKKRIENDMVRLGMDVMTLKILAREMTGEESNGKVL